MNTCWVAMTHGKSTAEVKKGEKLACIIALGYGTTQGTAHKNKAVNQQKFYFTLENGEVSAKVGKGFYTKMDLGIAKYHFEAATGRKVK